MFEDVDEDFDQELGQLSLGTCRYIYTKFVQFLDIESPWFCSVKFFFILRKTEMFWEELPSMSSSTLG